MFLSRITIAATVVAIILGGCAKAPQSDPLEVSAPVATRAYSEHDGLTFASAQRATLNVVAQPMSKGPFHTSDLAGRTMTVGSSEEIVLNPGEVVLTFDDGPRPGRTKAILDTLDRFGVAATFLMIGEAAQRHPILAQRVALAGHTVGTHTYSHPHLTDLNSIEAVREIVAGEKAVADALAPIGIEPARFFRFPYLAQTGFLRASLGNADITVLDVDVDSQDYLEDTPEATVDRTIRRLEARGSGIILMHDIHARTVAMLPELLEQLRVRGYSVVRLQPREHGIFGEELVTAARTAAEAD